MEGVHIERQIVELSAPVGHRTVGIAVAWYQMIDKGPHPLIGRMEDVCSVLMHIDTLHLSAMDIATRMLTSLYHQTTLACQASQMSKSGAHQSRTYYQIVISLSHPVFIYT